MHANKQKIEERKTKITMKTTFLLLCGLTASTSAFVVAPAGRSCCRIRFALGATSNTNNDDDARLLAQIQHDYKELQEKLLCDIVLTHNDNEAQEIEERMVEKAAQAAAVQRYQLTRILGEAERHLGQAVDDIWRARALKDQAHNEAAQVERDEVLLESSIDEPAENMERLRDQAVVHADHQLEEDAEILEMQGEYHRELAEQEERNAARLLRRLEDYENRLKEVLKEMRSIKATGHPIHKEVVKQQKFLDDIKWIVDSDESLLSLRQKLAPVQDKWKKEFENLQKMEHSVESDPDLSNLMDHVPKTEHINKVFMEQESHVHDSLLNEIQHAIDTDADLEGVVAHRDKKTVQKGYMEREMHKHDSALNEIEHSIATDPDLSTS